MEDNLIGTGFYIDTPFVCIKEYTDNKVKKYGMSLRHYAGKDQDGHRLFSSGNSLTNYNNDFGFKYINFNEFNAIIPLDEFNKLNTTSIDFAHCLDKYKPENYA